MVIIIPRGYIESRPIQSAIHLALYRYSSRFLVSLHTRNIYMISDVIGQYL